MARRDPWEPSLEKETRVLLDWLCGGFCIPPEEVERIAASESLGAAEFAIEVLRAEGFPNPEHEVQWCRKIRRRFVEHFGCERVSAKDHSGGA
jgi:transposase